MQSAILATTLAFVILLGGLTISVTLEHGFDVLTVLSLLVLALIGFGVLGALLNQPPDE
jgi:ribose/xylose/arabinose/galactoside ABC-type transport system permease subunit